MRVNAINTAYYQPKARKNLKNNNNTAVPEANVNFKSKTETGAKALGVIGGIIGLFVGGPLGIAIGAGIGAGAGARLGSVDDYNEKNKTDVNVMEDWEHDTKY